MSNCVQEKNSKKIPLFQNIINCLYIMKVKICEKCFQLHLDY